LGRPYLKNIGLIFDPDGSIIKSFQFASSGTGTGLELITANLGAGFAVM